MAGQKYVKVSDLHKSKGSFNYATALLKKFRPCYRHGFIIITAIIFAASIWQTFEYFAFRLHDETLSNSDSNQHTFSLPEIFEISRFQTKGSVLSKESTETQTIDVKSVPSRIAEHYLEHGATACGSNYIGPYVPALRAAFMSYGITKPENDLLRRVKSENTITIQISSESDLWDLQYLNEAVNATRGFTDVVIVPSFNSNTRSLVNRETSTFLHFFERYYPQTSVTIGRPHNIDEAMYLLSSASNLFAHGGPTGALAALSNGNGLVRPSYDLKQYISNNIFKWMVRPYDNYDRSNVLVKGVKETFESMGPVKPTCCNFEPFGRGDEEKVVCRNARAFDEPNCWVLSLGCNDKWGFEEEIVARTSCYVHVFDCSGNFSVPEPLRERVTFHKICLDSEPRTRGKRVYRTFSQMIAIGSKSIGDGKLLAPRIAKVDVEGWEVPGLSAFLSSKGISKILPHQLLMEVHALAKQIFIGIPDNLRQPGSQFDTATKVYSAFFGKLSQVGYELVHRADNPFCWKCSEVNLLLKSKAPLAFA